MFSCLFFKFFNRRTLLALGGIFLLTLALEPWQMRLSPTTVALAFLLVILFSATFGGRNPALLASTAAMLCFNYFFLPPVHTWTIGSAENLTAWAAFIVTALTAGELSAYARRRADDAENSRRESDRLYAELQEAFERASATEGLRRSEQLKSALLDAVTHDLRTPLTSVKASVTTLLESETHSAGAPFTLDAESRRELLEIINEETDRLNNFIESMVELARIEAGALILQQQWSEVGELINSALERAAPRLPQQRIRLSLERDLPLVRADSRALAEVLYTLLDNAAGHAPAASQIEIAVRRDARERIEFAVSDEGAGVPREWREKIFSKFARVGADSATLPGAVKGLGLGLAIAKGIVEAHGGEIYVTDAQHGHGAKFVFTIPIGDE